jgi:nitric oxide synthase-interacting protein
MGKHSKNNNDRAFFSNAERKAAAYGRHSSSMLGGHNTGANFRDWGWGTEVRTLDSDSMKDIDVCSLSLQPCIEPMITPSGVLYDKQARAASPPLHAPPPRPLCDCAAHFAPPPARADRD